MPIIHFTAADALQTKVIEAAIYTSEMSKIDGPKPSSSGKGNNYFVDITVSDGPYKGKTKTLVFSTSMNAPSLLGEMQYFPVGNLLQILAAIKNQPVVPADKDEEINDYIGRPFDAAWGIATVEGRMINVINAFHPKGYGATAPAF